MMKDIPVPTSQLRCKWHANAKRPHVRIVRSGKGSKYPALLPGPGLV